MRRSAVLLTVLFLIFAGASAFAQQTDFAVSGIGVYTDHVTGKGVAETATTSAGVLVSFRHFSYHHNGVEVNYSYTKNSQRYRDASSGALLGDVQAGIHEATGAYVFHFTHGILQPFALAGGGFVVFNPTDYANNIAEPSIDKRSRPVFLYGAGADVRVSKNVAVRAQYRALLYKAPDFFGNAVAIHTDAAMQMREPTIGLVYRF